MNYILSFCKITGASKIFSRSFYLPLLKPQTPKEALRTFKITGKWLLSSKGQHYIPVLFNHKRKRSKKAKDYGKVNHKLVKGYTYLAPVFDPENETHRTLMELLESKKGKGKYVYSVDDKKHILVFAADLELAIRDGDIVDVLVSQSNNKLLIKLKDLKKVPIDLQNYTLDELMYNGEGETTEEEEKHHHHGKFAMSIARIFEAKERELEEWELELVKIISKRKKQHGEGTVEWNEMVKESIQNLDWKKFEKEAKNIIDTIFDSVAEEHIGMEIEDFEITKDVSQKIMQNGSAALKQLPTMTEIPEIIRNMANATPHEIETNPDEDGNESDKAKRRVSGIKVKISSGKECFVAGQMVKTDEGDVFVPGQTIENEHGYEYAPGITINMDEKPTLITGLIMGDEEKQKPMFLPTDSTITADGQLTFTTNPEERPKAVPRKKMLKGEKKVKKKKKAKKTNEVVEIKEEENVSLVTENIPINEKELEVIVLMDFLDETKSQDCSDDSVKVDRTVETPTEDGEIDEYKPDEIDEFKIEEREVEKFEIKPIDDGMDGVIASVEKKKLWLQEKLNELRKLSISVEDDFVTYVSLSDANEVARTISNDEEKMHKISDVLLTLTRRAATFRERNSVNIQNINNPTVIYSNTFVTEADQKFQSCNETIKITLKSAVVAANDIFKSRPKDQALVLNTIGEIFTETMKNNEPIVEELCLLMNTPSDRNEICSAIFKELTQDIRENKIETMKSAINLIGKDADVAVEKIVQVLEKDGDIMSPVFKKITKVLPELAVQVIDRAKPRMARIKTEAAAIETLQDAIIDSVKDYSEQSLKNQAVTMTNNEIKDFVGEAIGMSKALGLHDVSENLSELLLESEINLMAGNKACLDVLKRMIIIRKLSEKDYSLKTALQRIKKNPDCGRTDPRIRQLVRESASLMHQPNQIRSSKEIPLRLFQSQNFLAIEDYLIQRAKVEHPILISRSGIQAVVPKEAARGVLAGRVPYVLIDESGFTNFKPMHMFSALKLGKNREKRFENYASVGGHERLLDENPKKRQERTYNPPKRSPSEVRNRIRRMSLNNRMVA